MAFPKKWCPFMRNLWLIRSTCDAQSGIKIPLRYFEFRLRQNIWQKHLHCSTMLLQSCLKFWFFQLYFNFNLVNFTHSTLGTFPPETLFSSIILFSISVIDYAYGTRFRRETRKFWMLSHLEFKWQLARVVNENAFMCYYY